MPRRLTRRAFTQSAGLATLGMLGISPALAETAKTSDSEGAPWKIGLAKVCTTPPVPIWLHGYASKPRFRPFDGKLNDLYAKAMAIEDGGGNRAVLITIDQCVIRAAEAKTLFDRLTKETGLERRQLLLNFSHTHSGPIIGTSDLSRYPMSDEERKNSLDYTERLMGLLVDLVRDALGDLKPARLSWAVGNAGDFVQNRRVYTKDGKYLKMGPNPDKYADRDVPVLRVDAPDGTMRAVVFGCACHAVTLDQTNIKLSGDYPSFAQETIEKQHPGVQAMFVQGCGADANSTPRCGPKQEEYVRRQGTHLGEEVCRVVSGERRPIRGPLHVTFTEASLPLQPIPPRDVLKKKLRTSQKYNAQRMLAALDEGTPLPTHHASPTAVWQFGDDLTFVALSGEVVSAYVPLVRKALGPKKLWIAGYSNEVDGYVPDANIVAEGGYESRGLVADIGFYSAKTQDVLVETVRQLAKEAGKKMLE